MSACACVYVRACVRVCMCTRVRACMLACTWSYELLCQRARGRGRGGGELIVPVLLWKEEGRQGGGRASEGGG